MSGMPPIKNSDALRPDDAFAMPQVRTSFFFGPENRHFYTRHFGEFQDDRRHIIPGARMRPTHKNEETARHRLPESVIKELLNDQGLDHVIHRTDGAPHQLDHQRHTIPRARIRPTHEKTGSARHRLQKDSHHKEHLDLPDHEMYKIRGEGPRHVDQKHAMPTSRVSPMNRNIETVPVRNRLSDSVINELLNFYDEQLDHGMHRIGVEGPQHEEIEMLEGQHNRIPLFNSWCGEKKEDLKKPSFIKRMKKFFQSLSCSSGISE